MSKCMVSVKLKHSFNGGNNIFSANFLTHFPVKTAYHFTLLIYFTFKRPGESLSNECEHLHSYLVFVSRMNILKAITYVLTWLYQIEESFQLISYKTPDAPFGLF